MSQSNDVLTYLTTKCVKAGTHRADGTSTTPDDQFDAWTSPSSGHIPFCTQCQADFDNFKRQPLNKARVSAEMEHSNACLWYDYFVQKMRTMAPNVEVRRAQQQKQPQKAPQKK